MKYSNTGLLLIASLFFVSIVNLSAQNAQYSEDQLIGKWELKTALFNGNIVLVEKMDFKMSFEFTEGGMVTFISSNGIAEEGEFIVKDNKIIDPITPEQPAAKILKLTSNLLILSIIEDGNKMILTFELGISN